MATLFAKTYVIPVIARVRTTCAGTQYVVETPEYLDVVTVNGTHIACTCGEANCPHIGTVLRRRAADAQQARDRALYEVTFNLSYGDAA